MSDDNPAQPSVWKRLFQTLTGQDASQAAIRESLHEVIAESDRSPAALSAQERVMLGNLLEFGDLRVSDVMVPRAEIVAADEDLSLGELLKLFREAQHSRLPLYRETLDDPTGLIHVKDVIGLMETSAEGVYCLSSNTNITGLKRPILFAPPSMRALDLLVKMQATHTHLALVIDEYGGTDGLVSIEDIIEEIVGDIADEHDEVAAEAKPDGDGWIADARMDLDDFREQTGHDLLAGSGEEGEEREVDSLGGLVTSLLGRVPLRGEIIAHPAGFEFQVLEADPRRIRKLRIQPPKAQIPGMMQALTRAGDRLRGVRGGRRLLCAFAAGAISASGFAPFAFFPALLVAYAMLVLLLDGADTQTRPVLRAAGIGWAFLFGQFLIGWHWIGYAFLVDPGSHLWQMPFALVGLTAGLALYGALACGLAIHFWQEGPARLFVLAVILAAAEWLRGHLFSGFPWNLSAYGWGWSLAVLQSASLAGAYGLSFLTILLGASLAELFCGRWRVTAALALLFAALWGWGAWRLQATPETNVANVQLRLVQPDIPQREKYVRGLMLRNWQRLVDLSSQAPAKGAPQPSIIIWPEAATGFPVALSPGALDEIAMFTGRGRTLITGSERVEQGGAAPAFYNSLYVFGPQAALPLVYDKFHLVPFGEYLPAAQLLGSLGFSKVTQGATGFTAGDHPHLLKVAGAPAVSPLICYEVIFPNEVVDPAAPRPGWIVNITDDSWFGPWAGPRQHLLTAQVRAIEEGLPIARAANTGISAVIGPTGKITSSLALNMMGVVDAPLPAALAPPLYAIHGDTVFLLLLLTGAVVSYLLARKQSRFA